MSLVENLINQISTQGLGGITKPFDFVIIYKDLNLDFTKLSKELNLLYLSIFYKPFTKIIIQHFLVILYSFKTF